MFKLVKASIELRVKFEIKPKDWLEVMVTIRI